MIGMIILSMNEFKENAERLSIGVKADIIYLSKRVFPDGELLVKISEPMKVRGENLVIYHKAYPNQNERLIELIQILDVVRDYGVNSIKLIIPYLPYARQDKRFLEGECITLKAILKILNQYDVDELITIDVHSEESVRKYFKARFTNLSALTEIAKCIVDKYFRGEKPVLISPDEGGYHRVKQVSEELNLNSTFIEKKRSRFTGEIKHRLVEWNSKWRNVIVLDDIISTGGTVSKLAPLLKEMGVEKMVVGATHLLMLGKAEESILKSGYLDIVGSNTIESKYSKVSTEELIIDELRKR